MKPLYFLVPLAAFGALVTLKPAHAAILSTPITVLNYSFEDNPLADGQLSLTVPEWDKAGSGDAFTANPDNTSFPTASGQNTPTGGDGPQSLGLNNIANVTSHSAITTVTGLQKFTLTVAVGDPLGTLYTPSLTEIGFKVNDQFVSAGTVVFDPTSFVPDGEFRDFSFSYTTNAADFGKDLKVFLSQKTGYGANIVALDNVRVSVLPAPEPSTWAMMTLGVGALFYMTRRRKGSEVAVATVAI
jgi:hypothetical protein